jgi:hypothetical protein
MKQDQNEFGGWAARRLLEENCADTNEVRLSLTAALQARTRSAS